MDPKKNPTYDVAWGLVQRKIDDGCPIKVSPDAHKHVQKKFETAFRKALGERSWEDEEAAVLNAAFQLGVIAAAVASIQNEKTKVQKEHMDVAAHFVAENCKIGSQRGRWCS